MSDLSENKGTIIVGALVAVLLALFLRSIVVGTFAAIAHGVQ